MILETTALQPINGPHLSLSTCHPENLILPLLASCCHLHAHVAMVPVSVVAAPRAAPGMGQVLGKSLLDKDAAEG